MATSFLTEVNSGDYFINQAEKNYKLGEPINLYQISRKSSDVLIVRKMGKITVNGDVTLLPEDERVFDQINFLYGGKPDWIIDVIKIELTT